MFTIKRYGHCLLESSRRKLLKTKVLKFILDMLYNAYALVLILQHFKG